MAGQKSKLGNRQFENCFDNFSASGPTGGPRNPVDTSFGFSKDKSTKKPGLAFVTSAIAN